MSYAHTYLFIRRRPAEAIPQNVKASKTEWFPYRPRAPPPQPEDQ